MESNQIGPVRLRHPSLFPDEFNAFPTPRKGPSDILDPLQIDVIAGDASQRRYFIKVATIDSKRLGHDIIKTQWDELDSDDDETHPSSTATISRTPIAILARQLHSTATSLDAIPVLILPYLSREDDLGLLPYLDSLPLKYHLPSTRTPLIPSLSSPTRVLLDITTILSMIADVCNSPPHTIHYDHNPRAQIEQCDAEAAFPILPNVVFPFLRGRREVLTTEGVREKIFGLLATLGSQTEVIRARALFGELDREEWRKVTIYPPPETLPLPIKVVPAPEDVKLSEEEKEKVSTEAAELYSLAISIPGGGELATANKALAKMVRGYYFVEKNAVGVAGRVLLHQPRSLRGYGRIINIGHTGENGMVD
jgi:hypothetical protein